MAPSTDTRGGGRFSLWCLAEAAEVLSKRLCVLMDLPFPVLREEIFLGLLSVPVSSLSAGFSSAPCGRSVGGKKGTPRTLPCHSACPSAPLTLLPRVFLGLDAAGIWVAERALERNGLLCLDQKQSLSLICLTPSFISIYILNAVIL